MAKDSVKEKIAQAALQLPAVFTSHTGCNADVIAAAVTLYVKDGAKVADVTFGLGVFWSKVDTSRFNLLPSDIITCPKEQQHDFRNLPYGNATIDVVVLDPPYVHNAGSHITETRYNHGTTNRGMYHDDIIALYRDAMKEAVRVVKPGGQLWVKCQDEVESGKQRWSHIEIFNCAVALGLYVRDLFILTPTSRTSSRRWKSQHHARKNHSYLWVFDR